MAADRGRRAATDGSYGKSFGNQALRGLLVVLVAVIVGIVLLRTSDDVVTNAASLNATTSSTAAQVATSSTLPIQTTTTPLRDAAAVDVLVVNASGKAGVARAFTDGLKLLRYRNPLAVSGSPQAADSRVYYAAGYAKEAEVVAKAVPSAQLNVQPQPLPSALALTFDPASTDPKTYSVVVVLGKTFGTSSTSASSVRSTTTR